jgi:cell division septum initiation protein DivIVA
LAAKVGVSLGVLDWYEAGRADPSDKLKAIAAATEKPVSWFTASSRDERLGSESSDHPADVGARIARSRRRRRTRQQPAPAAGGSADEVERHASRAESPPGQVERIDVAISKPSSSPRTDRPSPPASDEADVADDTKERYVGGGGVMDDSKPAGPDEAAPPAPPPPPLNIRYEDLPRRTRGYSPAATAELFDQVADAYKRLWEERGKLERRLEKSQRELIEERDKQGKETAEHADLSAEKLKRADANQRQLALQLEQLNKALSASRAHESQLSRRVSELETELKSVEEREQEVDTSEVRRTEERLKQADVSVQALAAQLEQATSALAASRAQEDQLSRRVADLEAEQQLVAPHADDSELSRRVSELETELRVAEARADETADRMAESQSDLVRYREQERAVAEALVWARQSASELSEKAEQDAKQIVQDAERRAAELLSEGEREVDRLASERQRLEALANEVQEDLSTFLLGTLERLKERVESSTGPSERVSEATADGELQKTGGAQLP